LCEDNRLRLSVARRATIFAGAAAMKAVSALLEYVRYLSTEFPVQEAKTPAGAAGQPKAAVSTKFLLIFRSAAVTVEASAAPVR